MRSLARLVGAVLWTLRNLRAIAEWSRDMEREEAGL